MPTTPVPKQRIYTEAKARAKFILETLAATEFPRLQEIKQNDPRLYQEIEHLIAESGYWWANQVKQKATDQTHSARVFLQHMFCIPDGHY